MEDESPATAPAAMDETPPTAPPETVVFIDGPDPDNFVLAVAAALRRNCRHVVLTGRPANLDVASRPFARDTCARPPDEVDVVEDSALVARATAAHLSRVAEAHGINDLKIYDGGVAPVALVAHAAHVRECFFGRPDLAGFGAPGAGPRRESSRTVRGSDASRRAGGADRPRPSGARAGPDDGVLHAEGYRELLKSLEESGENRGHRARMLIRRSAEWKTCLREDDASVSDGIFVGDGSSRRRRGRDVDIPRRRVSRRRRGYDDVDIPWEGSRRRCETLVENRVFASPSLVAQDVVPGDPQAPRPAAPRGRGSRRGPRGRAVHRARAPREA